MIPSLKTHALASAFVLLVSLVSACEGTDQAVTVDTSALTCDAGTFRVVGSIDDMSVDVTQPSNTGGFAQTDGGDFGSINNTSDPAGTLTDLRVNWTNGIDVGGTTAATATATIPTGPFPDDVFCAGKGTTVHSLSAAQGGGLEFQLSSLTSGTSCAATRRGALHACWRP
ncbi:MAG: hypothetical protein JWM82_1362 [Myxococcales bacterium]|nr:hypothetical protein [Myxococcales bacterium]